MVMFPITKLFPGERIPPLLMKLSPVLFPEKTELLVTTNETGPLDRAPVPLWTDDELTIVMFAVPLPAWETVVMPEFVLPAAVLSVKVV